MFCILNLNLHNNKKYINVEAMKFNITIVA